MYRGRPWTIRQYAGSGTSTETNQRFRYLLDRGQTGLSVALDLPTQMGFDSRDAVVRSEVGKVGVAIDTVDDMSEIFAGIPLDQISVHFTVNATAPIILAMFLVTAEEQGVDWSRVRGTVQNDILKEFIARKAYVFPPRPSLRLVGDIIAFGNDAVPKFNPISVTGYHAREAGCDAVQEIGFALLAAIEYVSHVRGRGLEVDAFASQLSFHFSSQRDLFEEICKIRAARRLWAGIMRDRFGAREPAAMRLRFFCGGSGASLSHAEPLNNVIRGTLQCLAGVLAGAQACHVPSFDEAYRIPSEEAALLSVRTQQIVASESGVTRVIDPLGGSYFVESLTDAIEQRVRVLMDDIESQGGLLKAIERGDPQRAIRNAAFQQLLDEEQGRRLVVGQNAFIAGEAPPMPDLEIGTSAGDVAAHQRERVERVVSGRDSARLDAALRALGSAAGGDENVMPHIVEAVRARATLSEITESLVQVFGRFEEADAL
jgi:methylmalonyl-CoA mutase N-terminal domain/subunit